VPHIDYEPDLRYSWDNGVALTTYLDGFKQGKIRGSRCNTCGRVMIPTRAFCETCNLRAVHDHYDLADTGTVETFTLSNINYDSSMLPRGKQNIFAVISIDGATREMGLIHLLGEVKAKDVKIGMRVKAVWKPEKDRTGTVLDVKYFRPMKPREKAGPDPVRIKPVELDTVSAQPFPGRIPMKYIYTAGIGGTRFYADLAKGKLSGTKCSHCNAVHIPPSAFCEFGMISLDPVKDAKAVNPKSGYVIGYTTVHEDRSGEPMAKPVVIVQVAYPDTVGTIFGKLVVKDPASVSEGMRVQLVASKKTGPEHVTFKPVKR
jgi:uncharacterized OB-fold protein